MIRHAVVALTMLMAAWANAEGVVNTDAAAALAKRVLGEPSQHFHFEAIPGENGADVFEVEAAHGEVHVRGSNPVAMASGLHAYLKYACHACVSWGGDQLTLPDPLPPMALLRQVTPFRYRYYFNYVTFSYSLPWWDWDRWEREIDWMALNGINLPLAITGQEAIWRQVYADLGLSEKVIQDFIAGPAYLPFGWMGCLDGWGGPLPNAWIDAHAELGAKILARERELGMTPVLQGFTGHVPGAIRDVFPNAKLRQLPSWCGFPGTFMLDPTDPLFVRIGKAFIEAQTQRFGTDHLYASDTFIEMSPPSNDPEFLAGVGKSILASMTAADPAAIWVMQGWIFVNNPSFWKPPQAKALLGAAPSDHMLLLDLFCDVNPSWKLTESFYGKPWVWSVVHNFGGGQGMFGNLEAIARDIPEALQNPNRGELCGLGLIMEGIEQNPVFYDLMTEMAWRKDAPDIKTWVRDYAERRYGKRNAKAEEAWVGLLDTVYRASGRSASIICTRPSLKPDNAWIGSGLSYDPARLVAAWDALLACADEFASVDTYRYDVVDVSRQALANLALTLHADLMKACHARAGIVEAGNAFFALIQDLDQLLAARPEFLLGSWIESAKAWAANDEEKRLYEWNARNLITLWGPRDSLLHEYAHKQWAGLLDSFYLPRWRQFVAWQTADSPVSHEAFEASLTQWEEAWTHETGAFAAEPSGDSIALARALREKYRGLYAAACAPDAPSLTTGKPSTCSEALPDYPAYLANDGRTRNTDAYWAMDVSGGAPAWWQVDLETPTTVGRVVVVGFYGDERYYGFLVETSLDGQTWEIAADQRANTKPVTVEGYTCQFTPRPVRYLRITEPVNSANTGRHLVEVMAYAE